MTGKSPFPRVHYNAPLTLTFCLACIAVFVGGALTGGWLLSEFFSVDGRASWADPLIWPRLILHVFGHATLDHLASNMVFILLLGPALEEKYGNARLIVVSLITAVVTGTVMMVFFSGLLLGASGVVFALIILSSFAKARTGSIPLTFVLIALIFLGSELYHALQGHTEIAHFAHIIGGVVGGLSGFYLNKDYRK